MFGIKQISYHLLDHNVWTKVSYTSGMNSIKQICVDYFLFCDFSRFPSFVILFCYTYNHDKSLCRKVVSQPYSGRFRHEKNFDNVLYNLIHEHVRYQWLSGLVE